MNKHKKKILLVDDDPQFLFSMQLLLESKGYTVLPTNNLEDGLGLARQEWLHLAVIDILLKKGYFQDDKGGYALARQLDPGLPKIFLTGHDQLDLALEGMSREMREKVGAVAYVTKKQGPEKLLEEVSRVFDGLNLNLHIDYGKYSPRMMIEFLKDFQQCSREEKRKAEEELQDLFCRVFDRAKAIQVIDLTAGHGGCAIVRVRPMMSNGEGADAIIKFGPRATVEREAGNYDAFVKDFVPHGSTEIKGPPALSLHLGAIKYSFVGGPGIDGNFAQYYDTASAENIAKSLKYLFSETCGKWYGSARAPGEDERRSLDDWYRMKDVLNLADADHVQELETVFARLLEHGASRWAPQLELVEDNLVFKTDSGLRHLPNPILYALREKGKSDHAVDFGPATLVSITHGDLNKGNVLVSKDGRTCLIDFFKTGIGPIYRDLAELESVIKFELLKTDNLQIRYELERSLLLSTSLTEVLAFRYSRGSPELIKALLSIECLRRLAAELSGTHDIREYLIALLFYALKEMVGFSSSGDSHGLRVEQYHALISAALICERLLWSEASKKGTVFLAHEYKPVWEDRIYQHLKSRILAQAYYVWHPKDVPEGGQMWPRIAAMIKNAHCGMFELTTLNGNVCFELGYAIGAKKPYFALVDESFAEHRPLPMLLQGDWRITYHSDNELEFKVMRALRALTHHEPWYFFEQPAFREREQAAKTRRRAALVMVANTPRQKEDLAPVLVRTLEACHQRAVEVPLRQTAEIGEFYLRVLSAELVVGCFSSDLDADASQANAELAVALGIATGMGKPTIILQEQECHILADMKTLTRPFRGADAAVQILQEELKSRFSQRYRERQTPADAALHRRSKMKRSG